MTSITDQARSPRSHPTTRTATGRDRQPVLELAEVSKTYPGQIPVRALREVSLTIRSGDLAALVGASGSGKSTLLNVMSTLDRPTSGRVRIAGTDVTDLSDSRRAAIRAHSIGFVFQSFHLLDPVTVLENVAMGTLYRGRPRAERRKAAWAALERVGLSQRAGHRPAQLSGGERQRVAIARALMAEPAIVLADEPTGNLDTTTSAEIVTLLRDLNSSGVTILIITHDLELARSLPRQVTLRDGQVVSDVRSGPQPSAAPSWGTRARGAGR